MPTRRWTSSLPPQRRANDNISITGTASLDGTLNVTALTGFGVGTYTLVNCSGQLTDNGLKLQATMPTPVTPSGDSYASRHNYTYSYSLSSTSGQEKLTVALAGDVLGTGVLGAADIDAIYQHLTVLPAGLTSWSQWPWGQAAYNPVYDVNHDGVVSQADVTYELKTYFNTSYADANLDTYTDYGDFQVLLDHWQLHGGWAQGDFNGDGIVDYGDFQVLLDYWNPSGWNTTSSTSEVPEPASISLLVLGALVLLTRRNAKKSQ